MIDGVNSPVRASGASHTRLVKRNPHPAGARTYLYRISLIFLSAGGVKTVEELPDYRRIVQGATCLPQRIEPVADERVRNRRPQSKRAAQRNANADPAVS